MTQKEFADMCKSNLCLRAEHNIYQDYVKIDLMAYDGEEWIAVSTEYIDMPSSD